MTLRVRRGDQRRPLTAHDRNAMADAADFAARPPEPFAPQFPDPAIVTVSNETGANLAARSVVALVEPALFTLPAHADGPGQIPSEFETRYRHRSEWKGDTDKAVDEPFDLAKYWNRYAITTRHANDGAMAPAIWRGRVVVQLEIRNRRHTHAEPDPGWRGQMRSSWHGTPILATETLTASEKSDVDGGTPVAKLAEIWLDPQPGVVVSGYLEATLGPATVSSGDLVPTTATLRVWTDDPDDGWSKSGTEDSATIEITNRDETLDVDGGTYLRARSDGVIWEPAWVSCVPSNVDRS